MGDFADMAVEQSLDIWEQSMDPYSEWFDPYLDYCPSRRSSVMKVKVGSKCCACSGTYVLRTNKRTGTRFLGCSKFPKCFSTVDSKYISFE